MDEIIEECLIEELNRHYNEVNSSTILKEVLDCKKSSDNDNDNEIHKYTGVIRSIVAQKRNYTFSSFNSYISSRKKKRNNDSLKVSNIFIKCLSVSSNNRDAYKCTICGFIAEDKVRMYPHACIHRRQHVCKLCGFIFIGASHMNRNHVCKDNYYTCNICGTMYAIEGHYNNHMACHK